MQLTKKSVIGKKSVISKKSKITTALAAATCSLLSGNQPAQAEGHGWEIDTAIMTYDEKDRVKAVEPVLNARKNFSAGKALNLKLVFDSLTGASPNGAVPSNQPQTFTRPSGAGSYLSQAGETPLDDTFKDSRTDFGVSWEQPLDRLTRINFGARFSDEYDYRSLSVNAGISRDFNKRNTTLSAGFSYASDQWEPEGGIPLAFAQMQAAGLEQPRQGDTDDKTVVDFILGVTQVINARTLMQLNYSVSQSDGYLTDPFKLLSVVDPVSGATEFYVFENRPDEHSKNSLYWKTKYHTTWEDTVDFSYRYLSDDWGINSHTLDFHYRWNINKQLYFEPHLRYYIQSEADFYRHSLLRGEELSLSEASADYRLAEFTGTTIGGKFGVAFAGGQEISLRIEQYKQNGDESPSNAVGVQRHLNLYPKLEALIVQVSYSFTW